jgi:hypothetical protein
MRTIAELIGQVVSPTDREHREGREDVLHKVIPLGGKTARSATYEVEAFNYLFLHKGKLGIESISKFVNMLVDGQMVLRDGRRLLVEVKLRMNWLKACQAGWQFRQFLNRFNKHEGTNPVTGGIVFFEEFSGL